MSIECNDLGFGGKKKKIQARKETHSQVSGRTDMETKSYRRCLKCSEASRKIFACLNGLWFRLYHTFTWYCSLSNGLSRIEQRATIKSEVKTNSKVTST